MQKTDYTLPAIQRMKKEIRIGVDINTIKPYWKNAKTGSNFQEVRMSIERYGNKGYIDVDENMVIIAGHSRIKALKELGHETTDINVVTGLTEKEYAELRIVDNEVAKLNETDYAKLKIEMRELDTEFMQNFFTEMNLVEFIKFDEITMNDIDVQDMEVAEKKMGEKFTQKVGHDSYNKLTCPHCLREFELDNNIKYG